METLAGACAKTQWQVHAYCLMSNHFHLVLETPRANLVAGMKWFLGTYTMRFNRTHRFSGHLFGGRYKAQLIDESEPHYLRTAADYVHLNPVRAGLVRGGDALAQYRWSSYPSYLGVPRRRPAWLRVDRVLGEHGIKADDLRGRREFERRMETQRQVDPTGAAKVMRGNWRVGGEDFLHRLLERWQGKLKEHHGGSERLDTEIERARRLLKNELTHAGWSLGQLEKERKGHPVKVAIAQRLREQTAMPLKWIAAELRMGTWTYANYLLRARQIT
jgi:REP element-mobilizing transposase RayT